MVPGGGATGGSWFLNLALQQSATGLSGLPAPAPPTMW